LPPFRRDAFRGFAVIDPSLFARIAVASKRFSQDAAPDEGIRKDGQTPARYLIDPAL
jgi:hypothetical protein